MLLRAGQYGLFALLVMFGLSACGGGDDSVSDTESPTVSSKSPTDGATDIERNATVSATFSEDMFASTIDGGSFTLSDSEGNVSGTVVFDALSNVATFTPAGELAVLGSYTASLGSAITDLAGNALASLSWGFSVRDGVWSTAALIGIEDALNEEKPQIAIDASGNAIAVWQQHDGTRNNIWANRYTTASGWGTAELIESNDKNANDPQIAMDSNGNAIAVWHQLEGGADSIYANRYVVGSGWLGAGPIENDETYEPYDPQIAMDASGNAIVVWVMFDGTDEGIYANRYTADGWGTHELIETGTGHAYEPQVAMDASGNAIAVWIQVDGAIDNIYANRYTAAGDSWGGPKLIESDDTGKALSPQIAMDASGNALAVWNQNTTTDDNIQANRYTAGNGWGGATPISSNTGDAYEPQIAINASGSAIAVWFQDDGIADIIQANRFE